MNYNYTIEHIAEPQNVWTDMISTRDSNHAPMPAASKRIRTDSPTLVPPETGTEVSEPTISTLDTLDDDNFIWPSYVAIIKMQSLYDPSPGAESDTDGVFTLHNRIWTPADARDLIERLFVVAHCGARGHRGDPTMIAHLRRLFAVEHLHELVSTFVRQCRLCLHSKVEPVSPDGGER
ncbi:hypothetical protein PC129_g20614 [Phytophthora cactorum]|nr:hypothetical protein Pcac1_g4171 [Phytophthora cactorum]KAG2803858.1 hypothetical protein PC112_g18985 [Phytophthora cactorum]KAG2805085.1 hypothetical protein PC111_g17977 [Phytophthora cactorum]KAG2842111.1 hypothetical protein PC113_g18888 [Phytophthora cactorum]KAG2883988.1 hypothetical protein PC117_g25905 [Phytophthora cactorum]